MSITRRHLLLECLLLFGLMPLAIALLRERAVMLGCMWGGALYAYGTLKRYHAYGFRGDWNVAALRGPLMCAMLARFALLAAVLLAFTWAAEPARLFSFPRERPAFWALVMVLYPVLSVVPQEIIFRAFFLTRYAPLFPDARRRMAASAVFFSFAHMVFGNWIALTFTLIGGLLFADTYLKSRSLALVCLEHALYGCWLFTLGLGWYFYGSAWGR